MQCCGRLSHFPITKPSFLGPLVGLQDAITKFSSLLWSDIWSVSTACSSITHPQNMCLLMKQMARTDASLLTNPVGMIHHQTEGLWASCTKDAKNTPSVVFLLFLFHSLLKFVLYSAWPHLCSCARLLRESPQASAPQCYLSRRTESLDDDSGPLATPVLRWTVGHLLIFPRKSHF